MCKWKTGALGKIPSAHAQKRQSWQPDADDVAAIYDVAFGIVDVKVCDMGDAYSANNKATAIKTWVLQNSSIPDTVTALVRGTKLYLVDSLKYVGGDNNEAD